ncbi:unnamed protein product [Lactuca saligna]|uniref:Uncharacterized protein n=1 Tax=Lactuca saligna TaxID=75948 RepID=A0AA36EK57_LACSI|nr:unnamed protein product [Lactuca saligna]
MGRLKESQVYNFHAGGLLFNMMIRVAAENQQGGVAAIDHGEMPNNFTCGNKSLYNDRVESFAVAAGEGQDRFPRTMLDVARKMLSEASRNTVFAKVEKEPTWLLLSSLRFGSIISGAVQSMLTSRSGKKSPPSNSKRRHARGSFSFLGGIQWRKKKKWKKKKNKKKKKEEEEEKKKKKKKKMRMNVNQRILLAQTLWSQVRIFLLQHGVTLKAMGKRIACDATGEHLVVSYKDGNEVYKELLYLFRLGLE